MELYAGWLVRVTEVDLSLQAEMRIVEFKSRVEKGESARKTEEEHREWSMEEISIRRRS